MQVGRYYKLKKEIPGVYAHVDDVYKLVVMDANTPGITPAYLFEDYKKNTFCLRVWDIHSYFTPSGVQEHNWERNEKQKEMKRKELEQASLVAPNPIGYTATPSMSITSLSGDFLKYAKDNKEIPTETKVENPEGDKIDEAVNHPSHYKHGSMEVIDMMCGLYGLDKVVAFCELNAFKYRMRAGYKDSAEQDIKKAIWYENKRKELLESHGEN